jgi:hypothetical protein
MKIKIKNGLIYEVIGPRNERMLNCPEADQIAQANGLCYAENMVTKYQGKTLEIGRNLKIKAKKK